MQHILDAILAGDTSAEDFAALDLPESYRAVTVHKDEVDMFEGLAARDKDPRKSLHVEDVALPELGPGEAYVAVMPIRTSSVESLISSFRCPRRPCRGARYERVRSTASA